MTHKIRDDDGEEWWRRRLGRVVAGDDEAVVRALFATRSGRRASAMATQWRAWTVVKDWRRSRGPQVIVKAAGRSKSACGVKACIRYIARLRPQDGMSLQVQDEYGRVVDPMAACMGWDLLSDQDNLSRKGREHRDDLPPLPVAQLLHHVQAHHFVISAGLPVRNKAMAQAFHHAVQAGIDQTFAAEGYRVLWAVHDDAGHRHAHVVVKAVSRFGERLRLDIHGAAFDTLRQAFAEAFTVAGIPAQAARREDRADLRAAIMAGRSFLRWPKRPGNGDLAVRAPGWFVRHGPEIVARKQPILPPPVKWSWWRGLFTAKAAPTPAFDRCPTGVSGFSDIYRDPAAALQCWRELAAGEQGKRNIALARWYFLRQPGLFGAIKPHASAHRDLALRQAEKLPLLPPLAVCGPRIPGNWEDAYRALGNARKRRRQRNGVLRSLWRLAGWSLSPDNPAQSRAILSRALSSLWSRPIELDAPACDPAPPNAPAVAVRRRLATLPDFQSRVPLVVEAVEPTRSDQTMQARRPRRRSISM